MNVIGSRYQDDFTTLEVFRRVEGGADTIIDPIRTLSRNILGDVTTGVHAVEGQERMWAMGYPYCEIMNPRELKLKLYERMEVPENRPHNRFQEIKRKLTRGVPVPRNYNERRHGSFEARPSLEEELEGIELEHDVRDSYLELNSVVTIQKPWLNNNALQLAFVPDISSGMAKMLIAQFECVQQRVGAESKRVAYPVSFDMLHVPFARINTLPEDGSMVAFLREVRNLLPGAVTIGAVVIR